MFKVVQCVKGLVKGNKGDGELVTLGIWLRQSLSGN